MHVLTEFIENVENHGYTDRYKFQSDRDQGKKASDAMKTVKPWEDYTNQKQELRKFMINDQHEQRIKGIHTS